MKKSLYSVLLVAGAIVMLGYTANTSWNLWISPYTTDNYYTGSAPAGRGGNPLAVSQTNPALPTFPGGWTGNVTKVFPDGYDFRNTYTGYDLTGPGPDIILTKQADVYVHYINARWGSGNSLGYFTYTGTAPASKSAVSEIIIFPNVPTLGGTDGLKLGNFAAGTHIGFVLVPNGYNGEPDLTDAVKPLSNTDSIFYTLSALNIESTDALRQHAVMFWDPATKGAVIGMEDSRRDQDPDVSDHDFNDVLFLVDSNEIDAIGPYTPDVPSSNDRDLDLVPDAVDDYPDDPQRAYDVPNAGSGTLAFEDLWPNTGDYDLNDLIVRYQVSRVDNAISRVKELTVTLQIQARGAGVASGFGIGLPGIAPSNLVTTDQGGLIGDNRAKLTVPNGSPTVVSPEAGQANMTWIFCNNTKTYAPDVAGYKYFNTAAGQPSTQPVPQFTLNFSFNTAVTLATLGAAPFNPFIFRTGERGREVHLINHPPTSQANAALFGTGNDTKNPSTGVTYYKTSTGLPWAVNIGENWPTHPLEGIAISIAYGHFANWVETSSTTHLDEDWYLYPETGKHFNYGHL